MSQNVLARALSHLFVGTLAVGCLKIEPPAQATADTGAVVEDTQQPDTSAETDVAETTPAPTCQCGAPFCRTSGLCKATSPTCVQNTDGTCEWDCDYPADFVDEEGDAHCDQEDNDCDGATDDIPPRASDPVACTFGVCAGAGSRCDGGQWVCDASAALGWESSETLCDDKDNDCNDVTDDVVGDASACEGVGVCAEIKDVACAGGSWDCTAKHIELIPRWQADELSCDGLDNDCDGVTDENLTSVAASDCLVAGVCAAGIAQITASCGGGQWACDYSGVVGHEPVETLCDSLDNDCDGETDEDLGALAPTDCTAASKGKLGLGVCQNGAAATCLGGQIECTYDHLLGYQPIEALCDGLDNDCDGETDEGLTAAADFCDGNGVCALGATATCNSALGVWACNYAAIPGYETAEVSCDNLDNDCNGITDAGIQLPAAACAESQEGVCKDKPITATCVAGQPVCDLGSVPGHQAVEVTCDNFDNDCDGLTDEGIGGRVEDVYASTCKKVGVCGDATKVVATCAKGAWTCDYALVGAVYQAGPETKCDNYDNDCDGVIDEGISGAGLPECSQGVCAGDTSGTCVAGEYKCDYGAVIGYENPESSCDGKDNNCDGAVDEGACGPLSPCADDNNCKSKLCRPTPGGTDLCCVTKEGECPSVGCLALRVEGQTECIDKDGLAYTTECTISGWDSDAEHVKCDAGACADGSCKDCTPGEFVCEGTTKVLPCDDDGLYGDAVECPSGDPAPSCLAGFPGVCLRHVDQQLYNSQSDMSQLDTVRAIPISISANSQVVVWQNALAPQSSNYTIVARTTDGIGGATTTFAPIVSPGASITSVIEPHAARLSASALAVVWRDVTGGASPDTGNIRLIARSLPQLGTLGAATPVANKALEQSNPRVVRGTSNHVVVAWQTVAEAAGNGTDVAVRAFTFNGSAFTFVGAEKIANETTAGDQRLGAIAALDDGKVLLAWTDGTLDIPVSSGVYARRYDPTAAGGGAFVGTSFRLNQSQQFDQKDIAIVSRPGGFVATWTSTQNGDEDIYVRAFNNDTTPASDELLVTKAPNGTAAVGAQTHPDLTRTEDGSIVVVWAAVDGDVSGGSIQMAQFDAGLLPMGATRRVNDNQVIGAQTHPHIAPAIDSSGVEWVLVTFDSEGANGAGYTGVFIRPMVLRD